MNTNHQKRHRNRRKLYNTHYQIGIGGTQSNVDRRDLEMRRNKFAIDVIIVSDFSASE